MSKCILFDILLAVTEYHNMAIFSRVFLTLCTMKTVIFVGIIALVSCPKRYTFWCTDGGDRRGAFQKKIGSEGPEVWTPDSIRACGKRGRPDGMAVPV